MSVTQPLPEGSTGELIQGIMASVSQYEGQVIIERSKRGSLETRARGRLTYLAPVGLINKTYGEGKNAVKTTEHDPDRARFIPMIFEMLASESYSQTEIIQHVNSLGFTMPVTGKPLTKQTLNRILSKREYSGVVWVDEETGYVPAEFSPLVSKELFDEVQILRARQMGKKKQTKQKLNPLFPLRGFVKCPICGKGMSGSPTTSKGKSYPYYHLPMHSPGCTRPDLTVRKEKIEAEFLQLLRKLRPTPGFKKIFKEAVAEVWREKQETTLAAIKAVQRQGDTIRARLKTLTDRWLDCQSQDDAGFFRDQRKRLEQEQAENSHALRHLQTRIVDLDALMSFAFDMLEDASKMWLEASAEVRQKIQWGLFPNGLSYSPETGFGNPVCARAFSIFDLLNAPENQVVPPTGLEPMLPAPEAGALSN